ncbi:MAG: DUF2851 family protein [Kiritimatiellae bacterium]|nr:DUF2851 family protein [Kiritimatiellia bacterium]
MNETASLPLPPCLLPGRAAAEPETDGAAWDERHLQCIWADARLRPPLSTTGGAPVEVLSPGVWNGGPGPDFRGAILRIGGVRAAGDVELHVRPSDWTAHGHDGDPRYENVVLHVAWFPPAPGAVLPDVPLALLSDAMLARPGFSFDQIDPDAYPHAARSDLPRPCRDALRGAPAAIVRDLLERAGEARLRRKARELAERAARAGSPAQAFYAEVLACLGFHANTAPMRALAAQVPVRELAARADPFERYALLLGRAGLLPPPDAPGFPSGWTAALWNAAFRAGASHAPDAAGRWTLAGVRPANHPRRRLAVAAALFADPDSLRAALAALPRADAKAWARAAEKVLRDAAAPAAALLPPGAARGGLLGGGRVRAILANAVLPALAFGDSVSARALLAALPGESPSATMEEMAFRLLGADHNPALWRTGALRMQGLLALWSGHCAASPETCRECPLAAAARR